MTKLVLALLWGYDTVMDSNLLHSPLVYTRKSVYRGPGKPNIAYTVVPLHQTFSYYKHKRLKCITPKEDEI